MRRLVIVAAILATLTGCNEFNRERGRGDAPVGQQDRTPKEVVSFPDVFGNVAHACDGHGHRIFVTTSRDDAPSSLFVLSDSSCGGEAG